MSTPALLALAEALKNTSAEIQSIGAKLHSLADTLEKEADSIALTTAQLTAQLSAATAALAAAEKKNAQAHTPFNVDVCVGIRTNGSGSSTTMKRVGNGCCVGCGGATDGGGTAAAAADEDGGGWGVVGGDGGVVVGPAADARSQLSRALSEVAERAERAASQVRGGSGSGSVVSRKSSRMSSSHASQK